MKAHQVRLSSSFREEQREVKVEYSSKEETSTQKEPSRVGGMCFPFTEPPAERGSGRLTPDALHKRMIVKAECQASEEMFVEVFRQLPPPMVSLVLL